MGSWGLFENEYHLYLCAPFCVILIFLLMPDSSRNKIISIHSLFLPDKKKAQ